MKKQLLLLASSLLLVGCGGEEASSESSITPSSEDATSEVSEESSTPSSEATSVAEDDGKAHIVILAGQSGARGKALNSDLEDPSLTYEDVDLYYDGYTMPQLSSIASSPTGARVALAAGYGDSDSEFGPELGIGNTLASRYVADGDRKVTLVKYTACGSTFWEHWYSKSFLDDEDLEPILDQSQIRELEAGTYVGPLTSNLYQMIDEAVASAESSGYEAVIDGLIWVHGEQDAKTTAIMEQYQKAQQYFIDDLRDYVGDESLPVILTEALTNAAEYSNTLRSAQTVVAQADANVHLVKNYDLYTNTFEPWHFGAESNLLLGNRAAAELISLNDTRTVTSIYDPELTIHTGTLVELPSYLEADFSNGTSGYVKVTYGDIDVTSEGTKEVEVYATTLQGTYTGKINITVSSSEGYIDGKDYETSGLTGTSTSDGTLTVYARKGLDGLYVAAKVKDANVFTDGEAWRTGDMGVDGNDDDLRLYVSPDGETSYEVALSAGNLMRIYDQGYYIETSASGPLLNNNVIYRKMFENVKWRVTTSGYSNRNTSESGDTFYEMYLPYGNWGLTSGDDFKIMFKYVNVEASGTDVTDRSSTNVYLAKDASLADETGSNLGAYFDIEDLI